LAGTTAASYVPGLPIVLVDPATGEKETFGKAEAEAIAPEVASGLMTDPATLIARFRTQFSDGEIGVAEGKISLPSIKATGTEAQGEITVNIEPGKFAADLYEALCDADMC